LSIEYGLLSIGGANGIRGIGFATLPSSNGTQGIVGRGV